MVPELVFPISILPPSNLVFLKQLEKWYSKKENTTLQLPDLNSSMTLYDF